MESILVPGADGWVVGRMHIRTGSTSSDIHIHFMNDMRRRVRSGQQGGDDDDASVGEPLTGQFRHLPHRLSSVLMSLSSASSFTQAYSFTLAYWAHCFGYLLPGTRSVRRPAEPSMCLLAELVNPAAPPASALVLLQLDLLSTFDFCSILRDSARFALPIPAHVSEEIHTRVIECAMSRAVENILTKTTTMNPNCKKKKRLTFYFHSDI
ncbi:hypothetical protein EYF80_054659 [Liparis tanakae]|uniref:Uncharacterized protein n=1 Tax=Liparis tanakae TaxID=230148 RepID=A0A4Z2F2A1_9TELE|nr:hypothetical protein EYF80_054659 [Liparis tanakae]